MTARTEPRPPGGFSTGNDGADGAAPSRGLFHGHDGADGAAPSRAFFYGHDGADGAAPSRPSQFSKDDSALLLPLTTELIDRLADGDLEAAVVLDGRGILPGAEETPAEFAVRLRTFNANMAKMEELLQAQGAFTVEDVTVSEGLGFPPSCWARRLPSRKANSPSVTTGCRVFS